MTKQNRLNHSILPKALTGIDGFDEISGGGLPRGRPTLICGSAGSGKTLFSLEFLVHGIIEYDEPGVFFAFEESREELEQNAISLGFDLKKLSEQDKLAIDYVKIDSSMLIESGDYNLDGLFIRLNQAIQQVQAKRVVLDTIEVLFAGLNNTMLLRSELHRLFNWLKEKHVTVIVTGERGDGVLTRHGIEEYVSDCVIALDHRIENQLSTRHLRIVKYRGTAHGSDEYPFLIDQTGFSILPITSVGLDYEVTSERVSSGIKRLDEMLDGQGFFRASTILVSGTTGTGKSTIAAQFVDAACRRGERCQYFSFEESTSQITRNMKSVGFDLNTWVEAGLLQFNTVRPSAYGLEMHLATIYKDIRDFDPKIVVMDPVTSFAAIGGIAANRGMLTRVIAFFKMRGITTLLTSLVHGDETLANSEAEISSLMDVWIVIRNFESGGERNRIISVLKSRGMAHSNQVCEFNISNEGIQLIDAYLGKSGVVIGSARLALEAREREEELARQQAIKLRQLQIKQKRAALEAQIAALQVDLEAEDAELEMLLRAEERRQEADAQYQDVISRKRQTNKPRD